jgi:hypothetical protein
MFEAERKLDHPARERNKPVQDVHGKLHEVVVRYAWDARQQRAKQHPTGSPPLIRNKRMRELEGLYEHRYGEHLPYDDAGIEDLTIMAHHIAHGPGGFAHICAWARIWIPDMPEAEAEALAKRVVAAPRKFKAARLGWKLRLTNDEREMLGITTIRCFTAQTDEQVADERKRRNARRMATERQTEREGRPPKPEPLSKTRPWEVLGMSRATWFRKGKPMPAESRETNRVRSRCLLSPMLRTTSVSPPAAPVLVEGMNVLPGVSPTGIVQGPGRTSKALEEASTWTRPSIGPGAAV